MRKTLMYDHSPAAHWRRAVDSEEELDPCFPAARRLVSERGASERLAPNGRHLI